MEKPSFGKPLEEHLVTSGREIAFPIEACVTMLLECGMQEEVGPGTAEASPPAGVLLRAAEPAGSPPLPGPRQPRRVMTWDGAPSRRTHAGPAFSREPPLVREGGGRWEADRTGPDELPATLQPSCLRMY